MCYADSRFPFALIPLTLMLILSGCGLMDKNKSSDDDDDDDKVVKVSSNTDESSQEVDVSHCKLTDFECIKMAQSEAEKESEMPGDEMTDGGMSSMDGAGSGSMDDDETDVCRQAAEAMVGCGSISYSELVEEFYWPTGACVRESRRLSECVLKYPEAMCANFEDAEDHPDYDQLGECIESIGDKYTCEAFELNIFSCLGQHLEELPEDHDKERSIECSEKTVLWGACSYYNYDDFCLLVKDAEEGREVEYASGENSYVDCVREE